MPRRVEYSLQNELSPGLLPLEPFSQVRVPSLGPA
jgi:hypothetical protein